ncbi:MAG: DUF3078 domain-containing protein [Deltaproteobacteria bacterium]|nr:MAG: DUF3078 domain-containing protein [Deltaproteobacteria bacterium]
MAGFVSPPETMDRASGAICSARWKRGGGASRWNGHGTIPLLLGFFLLSHVSPLWGGEGGDDLVVEEEPEPPAEGTTTILPVFYLPPGLSSLLLPIPPQPFPLGRKCPTIPFCIIRQKVDLPPGKGGVVIEAMTQPENEPFWIVLDRERATVARRPTGTPAILSPGKYTILAGSGFRSQMFEIPVTIEAGVFQKIQPYWGALVIHTLDETETPFRGVYEIFAFPERESYGLGRGAEEELGESVNTWLLKPNLYKIIGPTEGFRSIRNFATVEVQPGKVTHFVIVMDRKSGQFLGSGTVPVGDFTTKGAITGEIPERDPNRLKFKWLVGGNFNQSATGQDTVALGRSQIGVGLFSALGLNYLRGKNFWSFVLNIEAGIRKNSAESFFRKATDLFDIESIYIYRWRPFLGPYARVGASSHFAKSFRYFDEPTEVVILDGVSEPESVRELELERGIFDPTFLEEGTGVNVNVLKNVYLDLDMRLGLGLRHTVTRGFLVEDDDPDTEDRVEFRPIEGVSDMGGELIVIANSQLSRRFSYSGEVNLFQGGSNTFRFRMDNTFVLRISRSISVVFLVGLDMDQRVLGHFEISQASFIKFDRLFFR